MDRIAPLVLPSPPEWSLLLGATGRALVWIAIAAFLVSAIAWLLSPRNPRLRPVGVWGFFAGAGALFGTFAVLAILFATNRLEYEYVWGHGDGSNTLPYRIAGIWAGQEGSFLLWACSAALFGILAVRSTSIYRRWFTVVYSGFLASIAGILAYETPFDLNKLEGRAVVPEFGIGLAPSLQNYWVTIHPPTIFLGFGALTVLAAYAFAALAIRNFDDWIRMVRPWSIVALTLVGVGLCMGGFWAYETLGWGGFWMWDPVENVSFVPWVMCIALVHGTMVQITRKRWRMSNLLLGGLPFLLFVYGTFLTRSGALSETSVHSFAQMDSVAHKLLLGFLVCSVAGFMGLWTWRAWQHRGQPEEATGERPGLKREGFFRFGNIFLISLGIATAIGMSVPLFMALAGKQPSVVEEGIYHRVLVWMFVPLMIAMGATPLVAWRGMGARKLFARLYGVVCLTLVLLGACMVALSISPWTRGIGHDQTIDLFSQRIRIGLLPWVLFLAALCLFVIVANVWRIAELAKRSKLSAAGFLSHVGVATLLAGLIVSRGFERKEQIVVQDGTHSMGLGYLVTFKGKTGDVFDRNNKLLFELKSAAESMVAAPGMYYILGNDGQIQTMVWPDIKRRIFHDIYFVVNPPVTDASEEVAAKPGETVKLDRLAVKFVRKTTDGEPGQPGTRFGALLEVQDGPHKTMLNPTIELTSQGIQEHAVDLGTTYRMRLKRIDAATGEATLQLGFRKAIYPIEIFFKPMTILVWGGTALMTIAGLAAAYYRRPPKAPPAVLGGAP